MTFYASSIIAPPPLPASMTRLKKHALCSNIDSAELLSKLEVMSVDLQSKEELREAMSKSQAVVCTLGAAESEPFNFKGPYEVTLVVSLSANEMSSRLFLRVANQMSSRMIYTMNINHLYCSHKTNCTQCGS